MDTRPHVVAGAGPLGLAVVRTLLAEGRPVRVVTRGAAAGLPAGADHATADLTDAESAAKAFQGAEVVYHCAAVPRPAWDRLLPPLMTGVLSGAEAAGAAVVYGDDLYGYGRVSGPVTEDLPYRPTNPRERVRAELAESVLAAHGEGRVRAAIGRASDFFGPHVAVSEVGDRVFPAALRGKPAQVLPNPDTPHTYTFIDDFARGLVTLGTHEEAYGQCWHVPSAPTLTTRQFVATVYAQAGTPLRVKVVPKAVIAALGLVGPMMRTVRERLHQTENPFVVDHTKFAAAFGDTSTPHEQAVRETLAWWRNFLAEPPGR
jgi:nucleoside-diphosphate-sugar epimerase